MLKNKKIKNYVLLVLLFIAGIALTLYLCDCYKVYHDYQKQIPVIRGTLQEINSEEIDHYILENPTTIIYMCTSAEDSCRSFEKKLMKLSDKIDITDSVIYVNLSDINQDEFVEKFNTKYPYKVQLTTTYPAFVTLEEGKVKYILQGTKNKPLTISKTKQYLELNHIGE